MRASRDARNRFRAAGTGRFGESLADYFEGQALGFLKRYAPAQRMLQRALKSFMAYGHGHLADRAVAALGTLMALMGDLEDARRIFLQAIPRFEEDSDARTLATLHCNLGSCLMKLRRYDEARVHLVRALAIARRCALQPIAHIVRNNLAELEMRRGRFAKAIEDFRRLQLDAASVGSEQHYVWAIAVRRGVPGAERVPS